MNKILIFFLTITFFSKVYAQDKNFPQDPQEAKFETSDIQNFWKAFDLIENSNENPFETYIENGTIGLQGFIPNRIISADSLLNMVKRRKQDYEKIREIEHKIKEQEKRIKPYFYALEYWYPYAVYPPVYFVVGRFNSGGTSSDNGLLIGAEKLTSLDHLPELVIHESIHFQQKWPEDGETNLLQKSILEGMADFIAELVTGIKGNQEANKYGNEHDAAPYFRIFNPTEQIKKFDPQLTYINKWIPELNLLTYPAPIVDHKFARIRAIETYKKGII